MKLLKSNILAVAGLTLVAASLHGQGLTLNFANNTGGSIQFNGADNSFQFNNGMDGYQWNITGETGGSSALGFQGSINYGPFSYGPITTDGLIQSATVLEPSGGLEIYDGSFNLTGTVNFMEIDTVFQSVGIINAELMVNLTNVSYSGSNPDLQYLDANQPGTVSLTFQFSPGKNLSDLSSGSGTYMTSYSGSISVVPEPSTLALAGLGGLGIHLLRRRKS